MASIVSSTSDPTIGSSVIYSPVILPFTSISICLFPFFPLKYFSKTYWIPVLPINSFLSYPSPTFSNSDCVIFPQYPSTCDAKEPLLYVTTGFVIISIPEKLLFSSLNFKIEFFVILFAISTGLTVL